MIEFILQYQLAFSILFSLGSYLVTAYYENKKKDDLAQREKLNSKIEKLYGPVAANRMFHFYSLSAIQDKFGRPIQEVVETICENKDSEALEDWRSYYLKNLLPLDEELKDILKKNLYQIESNDVHIVEQLIQEMSIQQYCMQTWIHIQDGKHILDSCRDYSDGDWNPKNNCVEYGLYNEFAQHMIEAQKKMMQQRDNLDKLLESSIERNKIMNGLSKAIGK